MTSLIVVPAGQNSYTISNVSTDFAFKIRYINECGPGAFSNQVRVGFVKPPGQVSPVTTSLVDCSVRFNWVAPFSDSAVQSYTTQVQGSNGQWYALSNCGTSGSTSCITSMGTFTQGPFYMSQGQVVKVRVAAQNSDGMGPYSNPNSQGATIASVPSRLNKPTLMTSSVNSATFTWDTMANVVYEVYGVEPNSTDFYKLYESEYNTYTV